MDRTKFVNGFPGELVTVQIDTSTVDWAFVPRPIEEADLTVPPTLVPLLIRAREGLARLDGAGRYLPSHGLLLRPLQQREAITSSRLEGTYASPQQLLLYGLEPREPASEHDPANAWLEVFNYSRTLQLGQQSLSDGQPLSLYLVRALHRTLLEGVRGADKKPGEYRDRQVYVGSGRRFVPPPPAAMSAALAAFESFFNTDAGDPLIRAFVAHYQFEAIHPFLDGNGRIGRVLLALMVYRWCGLDQPWLYLSPYFERHKDEYIDRLFSVSSRSELEDWYKFCLEATIEQTRDSMRRIDELVRLKAEYQSRIVKGSARLHSIVEGLFETPLVTVTRIAAEFKVTYPTARADILKLERKGILEEVEHYYPKAFVASGVVKAAIED